MTIHRLHLHAFATLLLAIESKGLAWPSEMAAQRDVLDRASWMLASVVKKRKELDEEAKNKDVKVKEGPAKKRLRLTPSFVVTSPPPPVPRGLGESSDEEN